MALWRPLSLGMAALAVLAACTERPHEPVKVIAAPRPELPVAPPPAASATQVLPPVAAPPASVAALAPPRAPPPTPASAPPQRRIEPGEPNGNAAFRAALEEKFRSRGQASTP